MILPPLSLYIHIPWCVQKCPYCDFNSHGQKGKIPEEDYIQHLLNDLAHDLTYAQGRPLHSIFIGGGTPSLLSGSAIKTLLNGVKAIIPFKNDIEITLEANPGTIEAGKFSEFVTAGINRISIGVQSLQKEKLQALGRIHSANEAIAAAKQAQELVNNNSGLKSFNLDLMHGLPGQTLQDALGDLSQIIALKPQHISWYQLTIEPNTQFHSKPPKLPEDDALWDIQEQGHQLLLAAGYKQYEISGYALQTNKRNQYQCQHNLNYWRFGDYLGIGCGAHGKITLADKNEIIRTEKIKHPKGYMATILEDANKSYLFKNWQVKNEEKPFEFFMNRLRLFESCDKSEFSARTGIASKNIELALKQAVEQGLLKENKTQWQVSAKGHRFLNDLLELFV